MREGWGHEGGVGSRGRDGVMREWWGHEGGVVMRGIV